MSRPGTARNKLRKRPNCQFCFDPSHFHGAGVGGFAICRQAAGLLIPMQFLEFSEKTNRRPTITSVCNIIMPPAMIRPPTVSFFEKLQAKEAPSPAASPNVQYPSSDRRTDRVVKKNIERFCPDKEQYVVTTSEFNRSRRIGRA